MKRPRIFYFVAAWCCLALFFQAIHLARPSRAYQEAGQPVPALWTILPLLALGFVVWQTIGLVRLRRFHRWFAVVFFSLWSAMLIYNGTILLRRPEAKLIPTVVLVSFLVSSTS